MTVSLKLEIRYLEHLVRNYFQDFYKIEKKELILPNDVKKDIWLLHSPPLEPGEVRYYPISHKKLIIHSKHYILRSKAVSIGHNAKTNTKSTIAIGQSNISISNNINIGSSV